MHVQSQNGKPRKSPVSPALGKGSPMALDGALINQIADQLAVALAGTGATQTQVQSPVLPTAQEAPTLSGFATSLEKLIASSPDLEDAVVAIMARSARQALAAGSGAVPSTDDFLRLLRQTPTANKGGTVVRAFWWGFHIQISHEDLQNFLSGANAINTIVETIGGSIPSPAQPWIVLAATFIAGALSLLGSLDRGSGVYVSMSWFAPGVFVPTSV